MEFLSFLNPQELVPYKYLSSETIPGRQGIRQELCMGAMQSFRYFLQSYVLLIIVYCSMQQAQRFV